VAASTSPGLEERSDRVLTPALAGVVAASAAVLAACVLASFRLGFADDLPTLLRVNGPRVLLGAAAGSLVALSGALRLHAGRVRALAELELFAVVAGAAGGGFLLASGSRGAAAAALFAAGCLAGGGLGLVLARALDRPRRAANLGVAGLLLALTGAAVLAGTFARARTDAVADAVQWLLGDLRGARFASAAALLACAAILGVVAVRRAGARPSLALAAYGLAAGAVGPLAFVGTFAPRAVRALAGPSSPGALLFASAAAGGASVAAIDAVPRLLVGGYDFPWNVSAAFLAIPLLLGWNRARLRREVGPAPRAFEIAELALVATLTAVALGFVLILARVISGST
jgi:ABC-type Fe3+-siderophore transport system permease subunit